MRWLWGIFKNEKAVKLVKSWVAVFVIWNGHWRHQEWAALLQRHVHAVNVTCAAGRLGAVPPEGGSLSLTRGVDRVLQQVVMPPERAASFGAYLLVKATCAAGSYWASCW